MSIYEYTQILHPTYEEWYKDFIDSEQLKSEKLTAKEQKLYNKRY